ncbi:odorant receptor 131-2-like [Corythoichthys intestinalis]|uniref:odorant receptor 131-2-like n=1 Tax=Corythoichthys intestinalis TaxID=161448 RepID=UPI0025A4CCA6|nr:odorant receptor 131-2-like [Corythoichthys intestinalis]
MLMKRWIQGCKVCTRVFSTEKPTVHTNLMTTRRWLVLKMSSSPELRANVTWSLNQARAIMIATVLPLFCVFLLCVGLMLCAIAKLPHTLDTPRYLLFTCMLVNDTTMSLERFVAIFYPLRRPAAWRSDRIWVIILAMWLLSCMGPVLDNIIWDRQTLSVGSEPVLCKSPQVSATPAQALLRIIVNVTVFSLMTVVIIWTYIGIMVQTRKLRRAGESADRGKRTVLIHSAQLLLCGLAFTIPLTETLIKRDSYQSQYTVIFFNYYCFVIFPRALSPLIYGFRDQTLRKQMAKAFGDCASTEKPTVHTNLMTTRRVPHCFDNV